MIVWGALGPFGKCFNDFILQNKENYINAGVLLFNPKNGEKREFTLIHIKNFN